MSDVTLLLDQWNSGDREALSKLLALLYPELRRLADDLLRHERSDHTLQPTALVHEAYIRLTGTREMRLESRRLKELAGFAPDKARIVELRYFAGLSIQETADLLEIAPATVKRHWTFARAWLHRALTE
jgi:DNA-directed RNA polymerase specialized sigma24 family protein